jgi:fatty-acyl-CoA synthase
MNVNWIEKWAKYSPDAVAFEDGENGTTYTYKQADNIVNSLSKEFSDRFKIQKGDRIAFLATNHTEYVFSLFTAQKLGAILVPINFRLAPREIEHILSDSEPALLIVESSLKETLEKVCNTTKPKNTLLFDGPESYQSLVASFKETPCEFEARGEFTDECMILYTSGTTGSPKGATLTNEGLFWNSVNTTLRLNISQHDVNISFLPFFHTGGWNVLTTPFVHRGAKSVFLSKFDPELILNLAESKKATIIFGVPTTMDMMAKTERFKSVDLSSVRYAIVGGEPMPIDLIRTWEERDIPVRQGYGLTEFGPNVFSLNEEHSISKIGSIGFPNFYIDTKVIDSDGKTCGPNEIGELALSGPMSMKGYWKNDEATQKTIVDGWLLTGDLVKYDEEGFFYVVGRKKEMYISGGENVYPAEVEQVLRSMPEIDEAAVIGVPDEKWGEAGKAFLVKKSDVTEDAVKQFCIEHMAKYKVPRDYVFMDALPKGDSGKILKKNLK